MSRYICGRALALTALVYEVFSVIYLRGSAIGNSEGGSRLAWAEKLSSDGQHEAIWSRLSSRGKVRPYVALADSCA
jgi:hypothetical protein